MSKARKCLCRGILLNELVTSILLALLCASVNAQSSAIDYYNKALDKHKVASYKEAVELYTKAIELKPDYVSAYVNRGYCYLEEGELDSAEKNFNTCLQLDDKCWYASLGLSLLYFQEGDMASARWYLTMSSTIEPTLKEGMSGVEKLEAEGMTYSRPIKESLRRLFEKRDRH